MTTRSDLEASLAVHDSQALKLILDASGVDPCGATTASELAARIVDAMWWSYSTPLGYYADRASLEDIVWHVARKLRVADRVDKTADGYEQSTQLTHALLGDLPDEAIGVAQLDGDSQRRLGTSWLPTALLGGSAGSSFVARWGTGKVLDLMKTPLGRLLPLLPAVGPYIGAIKTATSAVHMVAGPLGVGLSVLTFNQALGANYRRLVPLVLSVGALRPRSVDDAQIIDFPGSTSDEAADPEEATPDDDREAAVESDLEDEEPAGGPDVGVQDEDRGDDDDGIKADDDDLADDVEPVELHVVADLESAEVELQAADDDPN